MIDELPRVGQLEVACRMCPIDPRCQTRYHRRPESCRYFGRVRRPVPVQSFAPPVPPARRVPPLLPPARTPQQVANRAAGKSTGAADLVAVLLVLIVADDATSQPWRLVLAAAAVVIPLLLASWWALRCGAWTAAGTRCANVRRGVGKRCQHHRGPVLADALAIASGLVTALNILVLAT
ncbi:hypothetical protein [Cellulomonas sp. NPDC058312]|uniref:hypothetical protein n=1 Tax=Cellulomonas sp. NPDC058312 TaxID=3346441 RepID=UPI0036F0BD57